MAGTRSSARQAAQNDNSSPPSAQSTNGTKRKADATSPTANSKAKRGRPSKASKGEQKTLEETMPDADAQVKEAEQQGDAKAEANGNHEATGDDSRFERPEGCWPSMDKADPEVAKAAADKKLSEEPNQDDKQENDPLRSFKGTNKHGEDKSDPEKSLKDSRGGAGMNALDKVQASEDDPGKTEKPEESEKSDNKFEAGTGEEAIESSQKRKEAQPSNILEKGIIYFFTRGRVGTDNPDSVQDLQRSFFVLRPIPAGAKITDGAVQDLKNARLFALPKKVWPKSGKDRFMSFVEKAGASVAELKNDFMQGSEYSTKTTGTNHTPNVAPIGEGVYAMTNTGGGQGTTHIAYMLTIPTEIGEVQADVGLAGKGSFVVSLKNPQSSGPANAQLPQGPGYPEEFFEEFRGRGWMPPQPKHLDYVNAQILLIGENFEASDNLQPNPKDEKDEAKETPGEELQKLEGEDEVRVEHLKGDDTIFADLGVSHKDYGLMTTW